MTFKIKTFLGTSALAIMLATFAISCDKNNASREINTQSKNISSFRTAETDNACLTCGCAGGVDSAEVFDIAYADAGSYGAWTPVASNFCGTGPQVTFEGQFNSIIRGADGWVVGYLNNIPYNTNIDTLSCTTVTSNIVPTAGNFIGNEHPTSCPTCPGYYNYSTGAFTRLVTVSKCCPEDSTIKVYVIKVTTLDAYSNDGYQHFNSKVVYEYKCFTCTRTGSCPSTPVAKGIVSPVQDVWKEIPAMFLKHKTK